MTRHELFDVSFIDSDNGFAVGGIDFGPGGTILKTVDGGENWTLQTIDTTWILSAVCFTDSENGTAVSLGGIIIRTTDGGINWTQQTSGTTDHLKDVCFTDANKRYGCRL